MDCKAGDWVAVLDNSGHVYLVMEVVEVRDQFINGFALFPEDGPPVAAVDRALCMPFRRPDQPVFEKSGPNREEP